MASWWLMPNRSCSWSWSLSTVSVEGLHFLATFLSGVHGLIASSLGCVIQLAVAIAQSCFHDSSDVWSGSEWIRHNSSEFLTCMPALQCCNSVLVVCKDTQNMCSAWSQQFLCWLHGRSFPMVKNSQPLRLQLGSVRRTCPMFNSFSGTAFGCLPTAQLAQDHRI